jgi:hypothetical protein
MTFEKTYFASRRRFLRVANSIILLPAMSKFALSETSRVTHLYPNATTTGVPASTTLKAYTGPRDITTNGTILSGYIFTSPLAIDADNVTIENSYFTIAGNCIDCNSGTGTIIKNCEFTGETPPGAGNPIIGTTLDAIFAQNCTIENCNFHGYTKDIYCAGSNVNIIGNYCWNMGSQGEHVEPIFIDGTNNGQTQTNISITGNTLVCNLIPGISVAGPIFIKNDFGAVSGVTVNGNLLVGGGFTVWPGTNLPNVTNISVTNNVLGIGQYGYAYPGWNRAGNIWSGNIDFLTGQIITSTGRVSPNTNVVIASFTPSDSFTVGSATFAQYLTTSNVITLRGCTNRGDSISLYDGPTLLGTTTANPTNGIWTFATGPLSAEVHTLVARDTTTNMTSAAFYVTVR